MPVWNIKMGRPPSVSLRGHRARYCDIVQRIEQQARWGAHAHRVLAMATSPSQTFARQSTFSVGNKFHRLLFGEAPKRTRGARVLPRMIAWTIYLTFAGAVLLILLPRPFARWISLFTTIAGLALGLIAFVHTSIADLAHFTTIVRVPWVPALGMNYHLAIDGVSLTMVLVTGISAVSTVLFSWDVEHRQNEFFFWLLLVVGGCYGVFLSADLFLLFGFYELVIVPKYFLIAIFGSTNKEYGAMKLTLYSFFVALFAVIGIVYAAAVALRQRDLKFVIGYSSVSHMGFVLLGLATANALGVSGAVLQMFSHGVIAALLFAVAGRMIYRRTHTRELDVLAGMDLSDALPFAAFTFIIAAAASMGIPGFSGFAAEITILIGAWKTYPFAVWVTGAGMVLVAAFTLRALKQSFFGEKERGVHLQEGRVPLDPDWNEQQNITAPEKCG